jgi:hypothetical protein
MDTKFRFLDQLERDLRDAASRPSALGSAARPTRTSGRRTGGGGRRHPWVAIAASLAILLAVAGAIGGLSQLGRSRQASTESFAAGSVSAPREIANAGASGAPARPQPSKVAQYGLDAGGNARSSGQATGPSQPSQDLSKIVRDGSITVVVATDGFGDAFDRATAIAEDAGGFVLSSSISQENQGTLTLRVPASKLDGAVVKLRGLGRLAELSLSAHDVTADYIDLKARLQVLQTQRELIVKLLNESTSVGGQLSLSNRFADVQTQIEEIQGSLNVLNDKVELATLEVTLREEGVAAASDTNDVDHPSLGSAWDRAVQGFFGVIAAVVVGLGYLLPLLGLAGIALLVRRAIIRRRAAS